MAERSGRPVDPSGRRSAEGQDVPQSTESLVDSQESLGAGYTERVIPAPFFFGSAGRELPANAAFRGYHLLWRWPHFLESRSCGKSRPAQGRFIAGGELAGHGAEQAQAALTSFLDLAHQDGCLRILMFGQLAFRGTCGDGDVAERIAEFVHPILVFPARPGCRLGVNVGFGAPWSGRRRGGHGMTGVIRASWSETRRI